MHETETAKQRPPDRSVALFSKGPAWDEALPLEEQAAFAGHAALMQHLARDGRVVDSGAFHQTDRAVSGTEVGLAVFASGNPAEVARLLADDPVLAVGSMQYRLHPWYLRRPSSSSAAVPATDSSPT